MMAKSAFIIFLYSLLVMMVNAQPPTRLEQCQQQRNVKLLGLTWKTWQPYYDETTPCELLCKVTSINHFGTYGHVEDGTPCIPGGIDICSNGKCQKKACDPEDKMKMMDNCGVCGGDNLFCRQINKFFNKPAAKDMLYNYHYLTTIPAGAKNIRISDNSSINYIALNTDKKGEYVNKDWRLDSPGLYEIAGSTALYQRKYGLKSDDESVFILGPTKQPINLTVIQQELELSTAVEYWIEAYPSDGHDKNDEGQGLHKRKEVLSKFEIIVNPDKDLAEANKADEEKRKLIEVYDITVSKDAQVNRVEVNADNGGNPTGNLAEAKQPSESNAKLLGKYVINVNEKSDDTSNREEAKQPKEARSELIKTYRINVGGSGNRPEVTEKESARKDNGETAAATGQKESLTNLLKMYTITVHNKSAPAVVEAMPVSAVTGADYILSEKAKKGVAGTQSDRRARRKELMRTYLINNQVPPVLKGSKLSYRIPANTNTDEIIPGPVIQTNAKEPCEKAAERDQNYVKQEPILQIEATQTKNLSKKHTSDRSHDIQADESAQTTSITHLFRPIPFQGECKQCTHTKFSKRAYCRTAFVARIKPLGMQVIGDEIRYDSQITFIYRSVKSLKILSREFIYTPIEDNNAACTCPRLGIDREYIVFGNYELDGDLLKLFITKQSIVRTYTLKHMYQLTRLQHRLNC